MDLDSLMTNWVWTPEWSAADDADTRIVYFRKRFDLAEVPASKTLRISADSRYKLYMNGVFVQEGPQKALGLKEWYVDTAEIAPFLREGENVAAVEVMRFPACNFSSVRPSSNDSLYRTELANLYVEDAGDEGPVLEAKSGWKCRVSREVKIYGEDERPAPIHAQEEVHAIGALAGWKEASFDDGDWPDAEPKLFFDVPFSDAPGNLIPRTIPAQRHEEKRFAEAVCLRDPADSSEVPALLTQEGALEDWNGLLSADRPVVIPARTKAVVEISAGVLECGYLEYAFAGGKGALIRTLCSECYAYPAPGKEGAEPGMTPKPRKGDRTDFRCGTLYGHTSRYEVGGYGTKEHPETYEPFWFRTFRYIRLTIETKEEPLEILRFTYRETGYPLDVKTRFEASDPAFAPIWDISVRTLRRCMHETYFDCPFYEQLQYAMDGRSEILYTYAVSGDDRLARQAMEAFRQSQRPDGMTNSDAPTVKSNVIPGFSIYYLAMVYDHMMYFGDRELVKLHLPAIDGILAFFDRNLGEKGLVNKVGGPLMTSKYWSFVDWSDKWNETMGVPTATLRGSGAITMDSLLYLYGLQKAGKLAEFAGRPGLAEEYGQRAQAVLEAVRAHCFGTYEAPDGRRIRLLQDGPGIDDFSVHCQVFGILTGVVPPAEGAAMLEATVGNPAFAQSSVSFMYYLFRAYETVSEYGKTDRQWDLWRKMVADHMTTCVENDTDARSDCHAWASLLCYELPSVILGVRPAAPGYEKIEVKPRMGALSWAKGDVVTPKGMVHVEWKKDENGACDLHYTLPG